MVAVSDSQAWQEEMVFQKWLPVLMEIKNPEIIQLRYRHSSVINNNSEIFENIRNGNGSLRSGPQKAVPFAHRTQ